MHPWPFKWYHLHGRSCGLGRSQGDKQTSFLHNIPSSHHKLYHHHLSIWRGQRCYLEECKLYIYLSKFKFLIFFAFKGDCLKAYIQILISVNQHKQFFFMVYNVMKLNQLSYHVMKNQKMWQLLLTSHNNYWPVTNYNDTSKSTEN